MFEINAMFIKPSPLKCYKIPELKATEMDIELKRQTRNHTPTPLSEI
jgi:hypothetical protein